MFSSRWSTFSLLLVGILAGGLGYLAGRSASPSRPAPTVRSQSSGHDSTHSAWPVSASEVGDVTTPETRCLALLDQLATPSRNDELVAALEKLAEENPRRAIALARSVTNVQLRDRLLDAAFCGWGKTDASAAADWILLNAGADFDAGAAIASMFKGAVADPDAAVSVAQQLVQANPGQSRDYGDALIYAFSQDGNFAQAAAFAAGSEDPQLRAEWLAAAFGSWASYQPQNAAAAAMDLSDTGARADALDAIISTWGSTDPQGLANFAETDLPSGDQRTFALAQALNFWAAQDPAAAAAWINQFPPSAELDAGEAAVATQPGIMQQPAIAINWAESITDPNLRSRTLAAIVETWQLSDAAAAATFAQNSPDLRPDDRSRLLRAN